jgi:hypothetical protein
MALYRVERCRKGYACDSITIEAKNEADAERKADDKDFSASEHAAEYEYTVFLVDGKPEPLEPADLKWKVAHKPIDKPLTKKQVKAIQAADGSIEVAVALDLDDIVGVEYEDFLDLLEQKVLKTGVLCDFSYKLAGAEGDGLVVVVNGTVEEY